MIFVQICHYIGNSLIYLFFNFFVLSYFLTQKKITYFAGRIIKWHVALWPLLNTPLKACIKFNDEEAARWRRPHPRLCCQGHFYFSACDWGGGDGHRREGDCSPGTPRGGVDLTAGAVLLLLLCHSNENTILWRCSVRNSLTLQMECLDRVLFLCFLFFFKISLAASS